MGALTASTTAISILFRLVVYIFLRWIPARGGAYVVPTLFALYVSQWWLAQKAVTKWERQARAVKVEANGNGNGYAHGANGEGNGYADKGDYKTTHARPSTPPPPFTTPALLAVLLGAPTSSRTLNYLSLFINLALFTATQDFLWTPLLFLPSHGVTFARLGHVGPTEAKVVVRFPPANWTAPGKGWEGQSEKVRVVYRTAGVGCAKQGKWEKGPVWEAAEEDDWVGTVKLQDLFPETDYEYRLSYLNGSFTPVPNRPLPLRTAPDPRLTSPSSFGSGSGTKFSFASSSCVNLGFPYKLTEPLRIKGFDLLANHLKKHSLRFLLFLGDFVYADVPLSIGTTREDYQRLYRQTMASESHRKVYEQLPTYHMYDDHEIKNNWASGKADPYPQAITHAWQRYNGEGNPDAAVEGEHYFSFDYGDIAFFTLDTRTHRSPNFDADGPEKTILGEQQKIALLEWLSRVNNTASFKFISSSVPVTQLWRGVDGHLDTWGGFKHERQWFLDVLENVPNVILLSGDRHEAAAVALRDSIYEFSTSPLSQFYLPITTFKQKHSDFRAVTLENGTTSLEPEDRVLNYSPLGNYKWTTFDVDTTGEKPTVNATIWIDAKPAYSLTIVGKPIRKPGKALQGFSQSVSDLLDLFGFKKRSWF